MPEAKTNTTQDNRPIEVERKWVKQEVEEQSLIVADDEWLAAEQAVKKYISRSGVDFLPCKLSRSELESFLPSGESSSIKHGVLIVPDKSSPLGYRIGMLARAKAYIDGGTIKKKKEY